MFILDGSVVTSASDLTEASKCEFAFLRKLDVKLGRIDKLDVPEDPMYVRTSRLGDEHEARVLVRYKQEHGAKTVEIARPDSPLTADNLAQAVAATRQAFADQAEVVFQATFFDGSFLGFADFIVRQPDGSYQVQDTKLARSARVTALLQLAAYAEQLEHLGVRVAPTVELLLGDGTISVHRLDDIAPVYRKRRQRLLRIVQERLEDTQAVQWGDPRYMVDGRCEECDAEIQASRDVLLVAGMRVTQRARLAAEGILTIDDLATTDLTHVNGIADGTLASLKTQARLQRDARTDEPPPVVLYDPSALAVLPTPSPGDIFFDFEGDPLYTEGPGERWGLDYLFGSIDVEEDFTAFWAHDFGEEREALRAFLDWLGERRRRYPDLHVYHYAAYERTHLLALAARHGVGEAEVDQLLRENVLVDLYAIVRKALRVGSRSYSIKKLEPLYMGDQLREGEVQNAAASITEYADARDLIATGDIAEGQRMLDSIADYNRYDCVSTLRLRDYLLAHAARSGIPVGQLAPDNADIELEPSPIRDGLLALAGNPLDPDRTYDQRALAFAAAAIDYHRRENKTFWQEHFTRLVQPLDEWGDTRDALIVESAVVVRDWYRDNGQRTERRELRLRGQWGPGSNPKASDQAGPYLLYEYPGPFANPTAEPGARTYKAVRIVEVEDDGSVIVEETLQRDVEPYSVLPSALTPASPPRADRLIEAIDEWGSVLLAAQTEIAGPEWPRDPMVDILRRVPPRTRTGALPPPGPDLVPSVVGSLLGLERSYLAVQGPPGTGKTYLGAHVIADLVAKHQWKIGVVAQSHSVVEHLLDAVVRAGLDPRLVGKVPKADAASATPSYTALEKDGQLLFALERREVGYVIGGTGWDFANAARIPRKSLDLLVVDEAGQFSLASTISASVAARNLLLLGDPQQLPQVSQGTHPEPVDGSALGWVSEGHDVLPPELGYFLAESRRMHPALTVPVSQLSYEGKLSSQLEASERILDGVEPGLHVVPVEHWGNATESPEEAAVVVELVRSVLGSQWTDPSSGRFREPLTESDVIVVTPYNAQLAMVHEALEDAELGAVRVGTVDKFQGQEAAIAIVSLAASSALDVPRGMSFLIMKNRLNVAISRAKWAAFLVYSPELTEYLPIRPEGVAELSAFIRLVE
ncbi:TM0106 family RecB-like putative nuclease [Diaminobutyricibacter tongyongensis]|uniref:TM0106 family RecB-like putative nuclease n=1 Tax=Leifsonia tongyongensis TaxID=1268043 RepID=A0A6L9XYG4_9MICO|nr:TM0106 family RecB-like putative nuclease [Diaminobutyricibacter tongyongensis]